MYAINGTPPVYGNPCDVLIGPVSLLQNSSMSPALCGNIGSPECKAIKPVVGVLGTPVINIDTPANTGTLYVVAQMQSGSAQSGFTYYHFLHALDITTLSVVNEKFGAPIQICGNGCGTYTSTLFSGKHIQRPGLLFANCGSSLCGNSNYVYVAFSMMDGNSWPYPNGFVFGYNATNLNHGTVFQFQTSSGNGDTGSNGNGIWMGGAAPAYGTDMYGNNWIYLTTANGSFDLTPTGGSNAGDSFLKLNPYRLTIDTSNGVPGYFTPVDQYYRSAHNVTDCEGDTDLGSGGVMLIPDNELANWGQLAVSGDKEGGLWFVDRTNPGGHDTSCDTQMYPCRCAQQSQDKNIQVYWTATNGQNRGPAIHTSPAYWEYDNQLPGVNYLYVTQQQNNLMVPGPLIRYPLCSSTAAIKPIDFLHCTGTPVSAVVAGTAIINFGWGATPSISADGQNAVDAIVWAISNPGDDASEGTKAGILYAIDAVSMTQLYSSTNNQCGKDPINPATKYSVPTVANGYVYVGTESDNVTTLDKGTFYIFGPNRPLSC